MGDWARKPLMLLVIPLVTMGVLIGGLSLLPDAWGVGVALAVPVLLIVALVLHRGFTRREVLMFLVVPVATLGVMIGGAFLLPDPWGIRVVFAVPLVLIAALVLSYGFTLPDDFLPRWTKSHAITITDENRQVIRRYLLHGRRIRSVGALSGYLGYTAYQIYTNSDLPFGWLTATFGGYMLGAAAAEVWALRPQPGKVRTASLTPRKVTDYVPKFAVVALRAVPVASVLLTASWPLIPKRTGGPVFEGVPNSPNFDSVIGWTVASVVLAILIEVTARRVVNRPQPIASEELVVVDDAIRSTSLHCLAGAGLALLLGGLARNLGELNQFVHLSGLHGFFFVVMIFSGVASPFAWLRLGIDQPWIVRRIRRNEPVAA